MSTIRSNKKKVSFLEVGESRKTNLKRSNLKRGSILKSRPKMIEEEKVIEPIENKTEKVKKYFKLTVQDVLQQGLLNIAMVHPTDPIRFLGNFLIEKSKRASIM